MVYSKYFLSQDRRIPTPVMILVVTGVIILLARIFSASPLPSKAAKKIVRQLTIVNLNQNQAGIFWKTDSAEAGWVIYGEQPMLLQGVALDDRDVSSKRGLFLNHFVTLKNLKPETAYFYKIISGDGLVEKADRKPYGFKTPSFTSSSPQLSPAYGKVIRPNGTPLDNAAIMLQISNAQPLFTFSKTTGEWLIPLNYIVDQTNRILSTFDLKEKVTINIYSEEKNSSTIETNLANINPLPQTVIMGNNYDFTVQDSVLSASTGQKAKQKEYFSIFFPKESAVIPDRSPLIKGTALPNSEVVISFSSDNASLYRAIADKEGVWKLLNIGRLSEGQQKMKVSAKNREGGTVSLERNFFIAKSGEQVLAAATGEATPTRTSTNIPSSTPTRFVTPTSGPSPTPELSSTNIPISVTIIPSQTPSITPPTSGFSFLPLAVISGALIIMGFGVLLAF